MRIFKIEIEIYDHSHNTSLLRELEMAVDSTHHDQRITIQFFRDLVTYGLDEAVVYLKGYVSDVSAITPIQQEIHHLLIK